MSIIFELLAELCLELFLTVPEDSLTLDNKGSGKGSWSSIFWIIAYLVNVAFFGLFLLLLVFILKGLGGGLDLTGILLGLLMLLLSGFFGYRVLRFSKYGFLVWHDKKR